jgi:hypothetical protein
VSNNSSMNLARRLPVPFLVSPHSFTITGEYRYSMVLRLVQTFLVTGDELNVTVYVPGRVLMVFVFGRVLVPDRAYSLVQRINTRQLVYNLTVLRICTIVSPPSQEFGASDVAAYLMDFRGSALPVVEL